MVANNIGCNNEDISQACRILKSPATTRLASDLLPLFVKETLEKGDVINQNDAVMTAAFMSRLLSHVARISEVDLVHHESDTAVASDLETNGTQETMESSETKGVPPVKEEDPMKLLTCKSLLNDLAELIRHFEKTKNASMGGGKSDEKSYMTVHNFLQHCHSHLGTANIKDSIYDIVCQGCHEARKSANDTESAAPQEQMSKDSFLNDLKITLQRMMEECEIVTAVKQRFDELCGVCQNSKNIDHDDLAASQSPLCIAAWLLQALVLTYQKCIKLSHSNEDKGSNSLKEESVENGVDIRMKQRIKLMAACLAVTLGITSSCSPSLGQSSDTKKRRLSASSFEDSGNGATPNGKVSPMKTTRGKTDDVNTRALKELAWKIGVTWLELRREVEEVESLVQDVFSSNAVGLSEEWQSVFSPEIRLVINDDLEKQSEDGGLTTEECGETKKRSLPMALSLRAFHKSVLNKNVERLRKAYCNVMNHTSLLLPSKMSSSPRRFMKLIQDYHPVFATVCIDQSQLPGGLYIPPPQERVLFPPSPITTTLGNETRAAPQSSLAAAAPQSSLAAAAQVVKPAPQCRTPTNPMSLRRSTPQRSVSRGGVLRSPPFISSPLSIYDTTSPFRPLGEWERHGTPIAPPTPTTGGGCLSVSIVDWINQLCHDSTLSRPSWRLKMYFQSSMTECHPTLENATQNGQYNALWTKMIEILEDVLQSLAAALHNPDGNSLSSEDDSSSVPRVEIEMNGELNLQHSPPSTFHEKEVSQLHKRTILSVLALYYNALESVLAVETKRLKTISHYTLLKDERFHRCLCAASIECVLHALSDDSVTFPQVLGVSHTEAFDFLMVSECFVRALCSQPPAGAGGRRDGEESGVAERGSSNGDDVHRPLGLPVELRRHLKLVEEQILESLLWLTPVVEGQGRLMKSLDLVRSVAIPKRTSDVVPIEGEEMMPSVETQGEKQHMWPPETLRSDDDDTSVMGYQDIQAKIKESDGTHSVGQLQQAWDSVDLVFRKLLTTSGHRISTLCDRLSLSAAIVAPIWKAWRYLLIHHCDLLFDRHIDQLILCTIYGVCKIIRVHPEISFRGIIDQYSSMNCDKDPSVNDAVIRNVSLSPKSEDTGNIISFYNVVYVPRMKTHLLQNTSFLEQVRQNAADEVRNVTDATQVADRATGDERWRYPHDNTSSGSTGVNTIEGLPHGLRQSLFSRAPTQIGNNIFVNTRVGCSSAFSPVIPGAVPQGQGGGKYGMSPRTRCIYNFGSGGRRDLERMNALVGSVLVVDDQEVGSVGSSVRQQSPFSVRLSSRLSHQSQ